MSEINEDEIVYIRGVPFPSEMHFPRKNIEDAMDYVPRDNDIIIASYPKTGTTWLQYIVLQILSRGEDFPSFKDLLFLRIPFLEMTGVAAIDNLKGQRMYKHHLPYNMTQKNSESKCIYTYRNPEDTVVSFYHFIQSFRTDTVDFDKFVDDWIIGKMGFGLYFDHVLSFYAHRNNNNLLLVSYEALHENIKGEILRIAQFLGHDHYEAVQDESVMGKIIEHTSFGYMKSHLRLSFPEKIQETEKGVEKVQADCPKEKEINFFRKGIVGDGKTKLSPSQRQRIREVMLKKMEGTELVEEWSKGINIPCD